jgi:hypothetical protein
MLWPDRNSYYRKIICCVTRYGSASSIRIDLHSQAFSAKEKGALEPTEASSDVNSSTGCVVPILTLCVHRSGHRCWLLWHDPKFTQTIDVEF